MSIFNQPGIAQQWLVMGGVPPEEMENCMNWAFGAGWQFVEILDGLIGLWNDKHGKLFKVSREDNPSLFFMAVGKSYMETFFNQGKRDVPLVERRARKIFSVPGQEGGLGTGGLN